MNSFPVCPYCDTEVPAHILKAHMAICNDSQRATPVRQPGRPRTSTPRQNTTGLGYYTDLVRKLPPSYKPSDDLEDVALDVLLSPTMDSGRLLDSLMPTSHSGAATRPAASRPHASAAPRPPPSPTDISTALFPATEPIAAPRDAPQPHDASPGVLSAGWSFPNRRSASSLHVRESTCRPSPHEEVEQASASVPLASRRTVSEAERQRAEGYDPYSSANGAASSANTLDRLSFLELTCDSLRQSVERLRVEARQQRERHDVLEETVYTLLQRQQQEAVDTHHNQPLAIGAHARPGMSASSLTARECPPPATPFLPQAPTRGAGHFSDIDLLRGGVTGDITNLAEHSRASWFPGQDTTSHRDTLGHVPGSHEWSAVPSRFY